MFKITWDRENNGVSLMNTEHTSREILSTPPIPVFYEELDLLGLDKHWEYRRTEEPLLWNCGRSYFYRGELVLKVKGGNIYDDPRLVFTDAGKNLKLEPINIDLLREKNKSCLSYLEREAMEFINTVYRSYRKNAEGGGYKRNG